MAVKAVRRVAFYAVYCDVCGGHIYSAPNRDLAELDAAKSGAEKHGKEWHCRKCLSKGKEGT